MNVVLITAGGTGNRLGASIPKQFVKVSGKPIIIYTIEIFESIEEIDAIVIVCVKEWIQKLNAMIKQYDIHKVTSVVEGGNSGQESIYRGLVEIHDHFSGEDLVLIHDSVRPLVLKDTILNNIKTANEKGSAITCVPMIETLLRIDELEQISVPSRNGSFIARAPQTFLLKDIYRAHEMANDERKFDFVDSCSLMHYYGFDISLVEGSQENIKITTPADLFTFKALIEMRESEGFLNS